MTLLISHPIVEGFYKGNENETIIFSLINNNFSQYDKTKMKNHIAQADELFDFAMLEDDGSEEFIQKQNEPQAVENTQLAKTRLKGICEILYFYVLFMENVLKVNNESKNTQNWQFNDLLQEAWAIKENNLEEKIKKLHIIRMIYYINNKIDEYKNLPSLQDIYNMGVGNCKMYNKLNKISNKTITNIRQDAKYITLCKVYDATYDKNRDEQRKQEEEVRQEVKKCRLYLLQENFANKIYTTCDTYKYRLKTGKGLKKQFVTVVINNILYDVIFQSLENITLKVSNDFVDKITNDNCVILVLTEDIMTFQTKTTHRKVMLCKPLGQTVNAKQVIENIETPQEQNDEEVENNNGSEEFIQKQNEPQAVENIKAPQEQNEEELKLKKVLIEKNKLLIEVEESEIKNERGCAGLVSVSRLYINGKLYIDADGVDTFYKVYTWGRNGVVEVNLKYTQEHHPDFKQVVLDQFDLKSYVGLKCKKSKSRLFNEWSKEMHENEKSKHFANISWKVFEKYNHLFSRVTLETTDNRAKKVKAVTTCEVEKALCDLVLLYTQSYHDKFIISDWYNRVDVVLKNLELAKTNTKEVLEEEIDNNNENEPVIKNNIIETDDKIIYDDAEEPELESNATQQANFTEAEVKQLKELYDLKNTMLEKIKNEPVTDETIKNLQSIIDEIDPEATINDEIIIQDEFISVLNYAIAKKQQAVENQKSANQKREGKSSVEQQKHKKSNRLLLTKKDESIMYLKQDFNKYIKKVHTRLREQEDFVKTMFQINPYCDKKYIGKNLRKKIGFLLRLEVILLANTRYNNSY